jgi:hypothetical protein
MGLLHLSPSEKLMLNRSGLALTDRTYAFQNCMSHIPNDETGLESGSRNQSNYFVFNKMAERVGFEPTLPFRVNTLSKRAPSATRPSLRRIGWGTGKDSSTACVVAECFLLILWVN